MKTTDNLEFPVWYDDLAEFEHTHKGYLSGVVLRRSGKIYLLTFYDLARLKQDAEFDFDQQGFWSTPNLVLLPSVTRKEIAAVVDKLCEEDLDVIFVSSARAS
jgi:hypothetical protein